MDVEEIKKLIASNLTVAAMLQQLVWAENGKTTTADGNTEALKMYRTILNAIRGQ